MRELKDVRLRYWLMANQILAGNKPDVSVFERYFAASRDTKGFSWAINTHEKYGYTPDVEDALCNFDIYNITEEELISVIGFKKLLKVYESKLISPQSKSRGAHISLCIGLVSPDCMSKGNYFYTSTPEGPIYFSKSVFLESPIRQIAPNFLNRTSKKTSAKCFLTGEKIKTPMTIRIEGQMRTIDRSSEFLLYNVGGSVGYITKKTKNPNRYNSRSNFSYHGAPRTEDVVFSKADKKKWIGFEAEKEDERVMDRYTGLMAWQDNFKKENDGSLSSGGFEFISPKFELDVDKIISYIKQRPNAVDAINARYSYSRCGGHITISEDGLDSVQLFDKIKYYIPMLYAMYPNRTKNSYCAPVNINNYREAINSRRAFHLKNDSCIELRIFRAIQNMETLEFRLKLVNMMMSVPANSNEEAIENAIKNKDLFLSMYTKEAFAKMLARWAHSQYTSKIDSLAVADIIKKYEVPVA